MPFRRRGDGVYDSIPRSYGADPRRWPVDRVISRIGVAGAPTALVLGCGKGAVRAAGGDARTAGRGGAGSRQWRRSGVRVRRGLPFTIGERSKPRRAAGAGRVTRVPATVEGCRGGDWRVCGWSGGDAGGGGEA